MKTILSTNPTFTPGAANAGTLDFSSVSGFNIAGLLAVLNQTKGTLLYATGKTNIGYYDWNNSTKVLTLKVDTSTHSSGDQLQVIYDAPSTAPFTTTAPLSTWKGLGAFGTVTITTSAAIFYGALGYASSEDSIGSSRWTVSNGLSANDIATIYGSAGRTTTAVFNAPAEGIYCADGLRATAGNWLNGGVGGAKLYVYYKLV